MTSSELQQLVTRMQTGDEEAVGAFLHEFGGTLRRHIRRKMLRHGYMRTVVGDSDVYQSVHKRFFLGVYAGEYDLSEPGAVARLLEAIASNLIIDKGRHWTAQRRDVRRERASGAGEAALALVRDEDIDPAAIVEFRDWLEELNRRLTDHEKAICALRLDGKSWTVVGADLGITGEAARKCLARAIDRVAPELKLQERCDGGEY